jgi:hypothetical protein
MKTNEARPIFRIIAMIIAIPMWFVFIWSGYLVFTNGPSEHTDWVFVLGMLVAAVSFSYIAIAGYLPRFLFHIWVRGQIGSGKKLR